MAEPTFQKRVARAVIGLCLGILVIAGIAVFCGAWVSLSQNRDQALLAIARAELASALDGPGGKIHVHEEGKTILSLMTAVGYEKYAILFDQHNQIVAHTANVLTDFTRLPDAGAVRKARQGRAVFANLNYNQNSLRVLYYPLQDSHGTNYVSLCAISDAPFQQALTALALVIVGAVIIVGIVSVLLASAFAHSLTRPLAAIAGKARQIESQSLAERIASPSPDAEIRAVTDALNEMLSRLESAFVSQQRFVQDASHELRSPLSNLQGTLEVALRRPRSLKEYQETLTIALVETKRLSRLSTDLLLLSRMDTGQVLVSPTFCDLAEIVAQAIGSYQVRADECNVQIGLRRMPAWVWGDSDRLRQVFDNLFDNALRYAPSGTKIMISVSVMGQQCQVIVEDQGAGITPEHLPHLFDRFYRADPSRTRSSGGAGLGLTIVRAIVEAHHGHITVESNAGKGTRFVVTLPDYEKSLENNGDEQEEV